MSVSGMVAHKPTGHKRKRTTSQIDNTLAAFHLFARLPPELRRLIWAYSIPDDTAPAIFPCTHVWVNWYMFIQQGRAGLTSTTADAQHKKHPSVTVQVPPMAYACREARQVLYKWAKTKDYQPVLNNLQRPSLDSGPENLTPVASWLSTATPPSQGTPPPQKRTRNLEEDIAFVRLWDVKRDIMYLDDDIMFILGDLERNRADPVWLYLQVVAVDVRHVAIRASKENATEIKDKVSAMVPALKNLETLYCIIDEPPQWIAPYRKSLVANLPNNAISDVTYPRLRISALHQIQKHDTTSSEEHTDDSEEPTDDVRPVGVSTDRDRRTKRRRAFDAVSDEMDDFIKEICQGWDQGDVKVFAARAIESVAE